MVKENLKQIQERIQKACQRAKRNPAEVTIVLVSKNVAADQIREAFEAGFRDFGENRVQELLEKKPGLPAAIRWHFQGHLQTNKVKFLLGEVVLLHSLDRVQLAQEIQKQAEKRNREVEALLQVNIAREATKSGFAPEEVEPSIEKILSFKNIHLRGLMTIGPTPAVGAIHELPLQTRTCFRNLRLLKDDLQKKFPKIDLPHLSMGMSSDFEWAIEEGATMVRIGTAVFGERKTRPLSPCG